MSSRRTPGWRRRAGLPGRRAEPDRGRGVPSGPLLPLLGADPNRPTAVTLVGRYALGLTWQDGHGSIFPFPVLRAACPCGRCASDPAAWPTQIRREAAELRVTWQDEHETLVRYADLRRRCPCAQCAASVREVRP